VNDQAARQLRRVLAAAVADPVTGAPLVDQQLQDDGGDRLSRAATGHGVAPRVWQAVVVAGRAGDPAAAALSQEARRAALQHARALADLRAVAAVLEPLGVVPTVVKGPALAELVYRQPGQRSYDDLDVLVAPAELGTALAALEEAGFVLLDRNWPEMRRLLVGQVRLRTPSGGVLDLHWHLINEVRLRSFFDLARSRWLSGLTAAEIGGVPVTVLDPASTLVHVALHAALSGGHRLVWLQDLAELAADPDLDWNAVTALAATTRTGLPVGVMLARSRRVLDVPVPIQVLRQLVPAPGWRSLAAATDRVSPLPSIRPGAGSLAQMVARSSRVDVGSSARELARRAGSWSRHGSRVEARTAARLFDGTYPASMSFAAGGALSRRAYLQAVTAEHRR
jgi:hypothetical protein